MGEYLAHGKNEVLVFFLKLEPQAYLKVVLWAAVMMLSRVELPFT